MSDEEFQRLLDEGAEEFLKNPPPPEKLNLREIVGEELTDDEDEFF